jgi:hypothetical protein
VWKDSEKEDRTIVNHLIHFHGVSSAIDDVLKVTTPRVCDREESGRGEGDVCERE